MFVVALVLYLDAAKAQVGGFIEPAATDGDPVDLFSGLYTRESVDLELPGRLPVRFERTYRTRDDRSRPFGIGTNHSYGTFLVGDAPALSYAELILADGARIHYTRVSPGRGYRNAVFEHHESPTEYLGSRLSWNGAGWTILLRDGSKYSHPACSPALKKPCTVNGYEDAQGRRLRLIQDDQLRLRRIEADQQRWISLHYDDQDRITRARDSNGREVDYSYDSRGRLVRVLGPDDRVSEYGYDNQHRMVTLNESGVRVRNEYDANNGRCILNQFWIEDANGKQVTKPQLFRFSYTFDVNGKVSAVDVVRPNDRRRVTFNADGYITHETYTEGKRTFGKVYERHARTNEILRAMVWCNAAKGAVISEVVQPGEPEDVARQRLAGRCAGDGAERIFPSIP